MCYNPVVRTYVLQLQKGYIMELTTEQQKAKDLILNGTNVFLTGDAGTGVAAVNIHGITIHRLLELNPEKDIINLHPEHVPKKLEKVRTVIVDEISMCRSDLFTWLSESLKLAEIKYKHPIHLVVVGDFYQLPPVLATPAEKEYFSNGKAYPFNTAEWYSWHFRPVVLHQVIRQTNAEFSKALNSIRKGNTKYIHYLNSKSTKNRINNAITLVSTNKEANAINLKKLVL